MLSARQNNIASVRRDAWVEVDLNCLEQNLKTIYGWLHLSDAPKTRLMAVVKSDAYGHGAPQIAELLVALGVDSFGVASIDEGRQLRKAGIKAPVLILSPTPVWAQANALENELDMTVTSVKQIADILQNAHKMDRIARVHLKIDTGLHRLGLDLKGLPEVLEQFATPLGRKHLSLISAFSHLAVADDRSEVERQVEIFETARALIKSHEACGTCYFHLASSEAARRFAFAHYDMVRLGINLYGLEPNTVAADLSPAMSVRARIIHIGEIPAGQSVGYGYTWQAQRPTILASIPIGYADGVDRLLSNKMLGMLHGRTIHQVGRISMDQMLFDITDVPDAREGDVITLIGQNRLNSDKSQGLYLADWAQTLGTITYELACRLRVRLPRVYTRNKK